MRRHALARRSTKKVVRNALLWHVVYPIATSPPFQGIWFNIMVELLKGAQLLWRHALRHRIPTWLRLTAAVMSRCKSCPASFPGPWIGLRGQWWSIGIQVEAQGISVLSHMHPRRPLIWPVVCSCRKTAHLVVFSQCKLPKYGTCVPHGKVGLQDFLWLSWFEQNSSRGTAFKHG